MPIRVIELGASAHYQCVCNICGHEGVPRDSCELAIRGFVIQDPQVSLLNGAYLCQSCQATTDVSRGLDRMRTRWGSIMGHPTEYPIIDPAVRDEIIARALQDPDARFRLATARPRLDYTAIARNLIPIQQLPPAASVLYRGDSVSYGFDSEEPKPSSFTEEQPIPDWCVPDVIVRTIADGCSHRICDVEKHRVSYISHYETRTRKMFWSRRTPATFEETFERLESKLIWDRIIEES